MEYEELEPQQYVAALLAAGFTQQEIEEATGIPQPTVSKIKASPEKDVLSKNYRALKTAYTAMRDGLLKPAKPAEAKAEA